MIIVEIPLNTGSFELNEMQEWCKEQCCDDYYYFPANHYLDEPAKFWFKDEADSFVFRLIYLG